MRKKIFLLIIAIFFIIPHIFAEWTYMPAINLDQPLKPGDWIYKTWVMLGKAEDEYLVIIYKGVEGAKVVVECIINAYYENRSMTETKTLRLPLDTNNQTYLNKADTKSTLLLTIIDAHNGLKVEETKFRNGISFSKEANDKIVSGLVPRKRRFETQTVVGHQ